MTRYNPLQIEQKWQQIWEKNGYAAHNNPTNKPKYYIAEMFPYPSGAGLHVGHVRNFTITDALARFHAQQGLEVLRPFGYDTFGLPTENYAIKTGTSPAVATANNIKSFRNQLKKLGFMIDWTREIETSNPEYYRWTQWLFLQLFKKGLAYRKSSAQWWCPVDKTVLANEQVEGGCCWRCGHAVEKKQMTQWFFKITDYAEELLADINQLDWPEKIKTMQKNWIGKSVGAEIDFQIKSKKQSVKIWTSRPETLFGATFLVLAPEHPLSLELSSPDLLPQIKAYIDTVSKKSEIERQENKQKTGVFTGAYAINPATGEEIPIWIADYVLMGYGEGAIMAVPGHDQRDQEFAKKFDLNIKIVIEQPVGDDSLCYEGEGTLVNSGIFNGSSSSEVREQIAEWLIKQGIGRPKTTYRMRDWLISRQRYWGCPIPIAYDENDVPHAIPEDQLPVFLPEIDDYRPDESGRSALAKAKDWLEVEIDGKIMRRETDTLDGYACSSWYLWRYVSPHFDKAPWDAKAINKWQSLDAYVGGDHAVAHLLYIRFWCKFFADQGLLPFREPVKKLLYNGYINAPDGKKMSKSKGNVIDPLEVIEQGYGADTLRTYELFIGPYDEDAAWDTRAIGGIYRFLTRVYNLALQSKLQPASLIHLSDQPTKDNPDNLPIRHKTIKKVTIDLKRNSFNTAIAALMEYTNHLYKSQPAPQDLIVLAKLLKPFAPHLASEILEAYQSDDLWPNWDESCLKSNVATLIVQINGKVRAKIDLAADDFNNQATIEKVATSDPKIAAHLDGQTIKKMIFVPKNKLLNIVI